MAVEAREWGITIAMLGGIAVGAWVLYSFLKQQGWIPSYRPRLARMKAGR